MAIDKLNLTVYEAPDIGYLEWAGYISEDDKRYKFYKYFCKLDKAEVMWKPHKFGKETNYSFPYCKIDINPKYFDSYSSFHYYLMRLFGADRNIALNIFNVSRIDVASDIEGLAFDTALSRLNVLGYKRDSLSIYKGSTMYLGSNPMIRVYDKIKEIKYRLKKGQEVIAYEKALFESDKQVTRFEIAVKPERMTLEDVVNDPISLASYFDKLRFYNFEDDDKIASLGGLQFLFSQMRREKRTALEKFKDTDLEALVKANYISSIREWFGMDTALEEIPF